MNNLKSTEFSTLCTQYYSSDLSVTFSNSLICLWCGRVRSICISMTIVSVMDSSWLLSTIFTAYSLPVSLHTHLLTVLERPLCAFVRVVWVSIYSRTSNTLWDSHYREVILCWRQKCIAHHGDWEHWKVSFIQGCPFHCIPSRNLHVGAYDENCHSNW